MVAMGLEMALGEAGYVDGERRVLSKPFKAQELLAAVDALIV